MKVLHGMVEVASQVIYSVKGLRANNVDAQMVIWKEDPRKYDADKSLGIKGSMKNPLNVFKVVKFAVKATFSYDCFHFHFAKSLIPGNFDLPLLRKMGKKIFFEFHGSELRGMIRRIPYKHFTPRPEDKKQKRRLLKIGKYADGFILHDEELRGHLPDADVPVHIVPLRMDIEQFVPAYSNPTKDKPLIVHAPSHRGNKGTEVILREIKKIKCPYEFELVEGRAQQEAFDIYRKADIIVDQIGAGTYGVLSIEGMALGKPVMTYISEEMRESLPKSLPIVNIEPDNLTEKLTTLLEDGKLRETLGKQGREYVEKYHDYRKNGEMLKDIYEEG